MDEISISLESELNERVKKHWQQLPIDSSFQALPFYQALESSAAIGAKSGWFPLYVLYTAPDDMGLVLGFIKVHSYGEYVFDWQWANAYYEHNKDYYPKLTVTVPFSPIPVSKVLRKNASSALPVSLLLTKIAKELRLSGWHYLFADPTSRDNLVFPSAMARKTVAFLWHNYDYQNFDAYLTALNSKRRKAIRRERNAVAKQGIAIEQLAGAEIGEEVLEAFYQCYQMTYALRGQQPYLPKQFFAEIIQLQPESILLICARKTGQIVACSWFFKDQDTLFGRYWGALEDIDHLHFELCYYQGIDYCIANGMQHFDPGTQGEHKVKRGFEPYLVNSFHHLTDQAFSPAIARYCHEEANEAECRMQALTKSLPFNADQLVRLNARKSTSEC